MVDQIFTGCVHEIPGDCKQRRMGEDGYLHFPEGECREEAPKEDENSK
jgi:hypothetical protein